MNRCIMILQHPLTVMCSLAISIYIGFFVNFSWLYTFFSYSIVHFLIIFAIFVFQVLLFLIFVSNIFISISNIFSHKKLYLRFCVHIIMACVSMLLLALLVLLVSVFFMNDDIHEDTKNIIALEIAEQSSITETASEINLLPQGTELPFNLYKGDNSLLQNLFKNNHRYFFSIPFYLSLVVMVLVICIIAGYCAFLQKRATNTKNKAKIILDLIMRNVQFIAVSTIKAVDTIRIFAPIWILVIIPYIIIVFVNKTLMNAMIYYVYIYYIIGGMFFIANFIIICIRVKRPFRNIIKAFCYPIMVSFLTGRSIVAMYDSVQYAVKYLNVNKLGVRYFLPLYIIFVRAGYMVYLVFITFVLAKFFNVTLGAVDFIFLAVFAILFSFFPTGEQSISLVCVLPFFFFLFGIPIIPALIVMLGLEVLFVPMRSAVTTSYGITMITLFESKHEKIILPN